MTVRETARGIRVRVLSNLDSFGPQASEHIDNQYIGTGRNGFDRFMKLVVAAIRSPRFDVVFFDCAAFETLVFSFLNYLWPFNRSKLVTADLILRIPRTRAQRIVARLKRLAFRRVQLFILFHRDCDGYTEHFGINRKRVIYVPFKVNAFELLKAQLPLEGQYVFSGGVSLRDWKTLAQAVKGLDVKVVILGSTEVMGTGQSAEDTMPDNVQIVHDDGSQLSWVQHMAESKFVVLPISPDSIAASGISTYLMAMALKKCVIITEGPATKGILENHKNSVIVPPRDPDALRRAIQQVDADREFRERLAEAGYRYAMSLGDANRLYRDYASCILTLARGSREE